MTDSLPDGVEILRPSGGRYASVLTPEALAFVADLQRRIGPGRERILAARGERWTRLRAGEQPERPSPVPEGKVVHFHVTDEGVDGEWLVRGGHGGVAVETGHGKGDVALRGPASAVLLVMLRRLPPDDPAVEVIGDRSLLDAWLAATPF